MNKKEYMRKLKRQLRELPDHIVEDILRDYEEHFGDGKLQGLSEEAISRSLGDPREVAKEYLRMYPHAKKKKDSKIWDFLWFLLIVIGGIWVIINFIPFIFKVTGSIIGALFGFIFFLISLILVVVLVAIIFGLVKGKEAFNFVIGDRKFTFKSNGEESAENRVYETRTIVEEVSKIVLDSHLSEVLVQQEDRNDIFVELDGYSSIVRNPLSVELVNGVLTIMDNIPSQTIVNKSVTSNMKLRVRVPQNTYDLAVKSAIGSIKIKGNFHHLDADAALGSLRIEGNQKTANVNCDMGSIRIYHNLGSGNYTSNMGSIRWYQAGDNPHKFVVKKSLGSFKNNSDKIFQQYNSNTFESRDGILPEVRIISNMGSILLEN